MSGASIFTIAASVVIGVVVLLLILRLIAGRARALIAQNFPTEAIVLQDDMANNFGLTSKGAVQLRGNGGLVLTKEELCFLPIFGDALHIPRSKIEKVSTVRSHLGKTVGRKLLKVEFEGDSVAFSVRDVEGWIGVLVTRPS